MNKIKKFKDLTSKHGLSYVLNLIYRNKIFPPIDNFVFFLCKKASANKNLSKIIVLESHNDFDSNGGAFYEYLIKNNYNKKYKIVWFLWNDKSRHDSLPTNVEAIPFYKFSIKRNYYMCTARYLIGDDSSTLKKVKDNQILIHLRHGAGGFKNVKGFTTIKDNVNYILGMSEGYASIESDQLSLHYPDPRLIFIGFPAHDYLFQDNRVELKKILNNDNFRKKIIWMPTFRKGGGVNRNDSDLEFPMGIPLLSSETEYEYLNHFLAENNLFLIIKIHPKQDLDDLRIYDQTNIKVLTGDDVKTLEIDNYRLMSSCDAMISDYSGAAYDFLQLDRPIAYVLSDINEYRLGFVVKDIHTLMAGHEIYSFDDMIKFLCDVSNDNDCFSERRKKIRNYLYKYHDDKNSERLAKLLELEK
jgi:CDP-glycerol glycerophosphotransferase (TagB/SpsB family)